MENDFLFQRLHALKQFSTVEVFQRQFELLQRLVAARYPDLDEAYYVSCCVNGLKDDIKNVVQFYQPLTVRYALRLATFQESIFADEARVIVEDVIVEQTLSVEGSKCDIGEEEAVPHVSNEDQSDDTIQNSIAPWFISIDSGHTTILENQNVHFRMNTEQFVTKEVAISLEEVVSDEDSQVINTQVLSCSRIEYFSVSKNLLQTSVQTHCIEMLHMVFYFSNTNEFMDQFRPLLAFKGGTLQKSMELLEESIFIGLGNSNEISFPWNTTSVLYEKRDIHGHLQHCYPSPCRDVQFIFHWEPDPACFSLQQWQKITMHLRLTISVLGGVIRNLANAYTEGISAVPSSMHGKRPLSQVDNILIFQGVKSTIMCNSGASKNKNIYGSVVSHKELPVSDTVDADSVDYGGYHPDNVDRVPAVRVDMIVLTVYSDWLEYVRENVFCEYDPKVMKASLTYVNGAMCSIMFNPTSGCGQEFLKTSPIFASNEVLIAWLYLVVRFFVGSTVYLECFGPGITQTQLCASEGGLLVEEKQAILTLVGDKSISIKSPVSNQVLQDIDEWRAINHWSLLCDQPSLLVNHQFKSLLAFKGGTDITVYVPIRSQDVLMPLSLNALWPIVLSSLNTQEGGDTHSDNHGALFKDQVNLNFTIVDGRSTFHKVNIFDNPTKPNFRRNKSTEIGSVDHAMLLILRKHSVILVQLYRPMGTWFFDPSIRCIMSTNSKSLGVHGCRHALLFFYCCSTLGQSELFLCSVVMLFLPDTVEQFYAHFKASCLCMFRQGCFLISSVQEEELATEEVQCKGLHRRDMLVFAQQEEYLTADNMGDDGNVQSQSVLYVSLLDTPAAGLKRVLSISLFILNFSPEATKGDLCVWGSSSATEHSVRSKLQLIEDCKQTVMGMWKCMARHKVKEPGMLNNAVGITCIILMAGQSKFNCEWQLFLDLTLKIICIQLKDFVLVICNTSLHGARIQLMTKYGCPYVGTCVDFQCIILGVLLLVCGGTWVDTLWRIAWTNGT